MLFLCFSLISLQLQAQTFSLVANTWPPYVDSALHENGLAMNIVKTAFARVGYTPEIRIEKWEKALQGSEMGVYDIVGALWKTKEREQTLLYSDPYLTNNIVLITHSQSHLKFNSLDDLKGVLIGVLKGYEYDEAFMNDHQILKFQANRLTQNLISVQNGKLDVAVADKRLAMYELKHFMGNNIKNFRFLAKPLSSRQLYIAAPIERPESKNLIAKFNQGLAEIKKDGTYQKILDGYIF